MTRDSFIIAGLLITLLFLITSIFFVVFGQVTVRKLRKNPETKAALGMELASGWNIFNVAFILSIPRSFSCILNNGAMSFYFPNAEILNRYTTITDRVLAKILFYFSLISCACLFSLMTIEKFGVVK